MRGQYDAALRQLEGAKTSGASPAEVENLRGVATMLAGDAKKALPMFERALALSPALAEARLNRAVALLRSGEPAKASSDLEKIWNDEHSHLRASAAYHNGLALDALQRSEEAERWLLRALELDPAFDAALLYVATLRERRGELQLAGRAYLDYLKKYPDSLVAALRFGISAHRAGRVDVARTYLQRVIDKAPQSPEAAEARKFLVMWE